LINTAENCCSNKLAPLERLCLETPDSVIEQALLFDTNTKKNMQEYKMQKFS